LVPPTASWRTNVAGASGPEMARIVVAHQSGAGHELELRDYLRVVWRGRWLILIATVVMVGATLGLSARQEPVYEAEALFLLGPRVSASLGNARGSQESTDTEVTAEASTAELAAATATPTSAPKSSTDCNRGSTSWAGSARRSSPRSASCRSSSLPSTRSWRPPRPWSCRWSRSFRPASAASSRARSVRSRPSSGR
jgi:hypothetical protein